MKPLTALEKDALKEIASIGSGHASTALSQLIDRPVGVGMIHLEKMPVKDIPDLVGGPSADAVGITFGVRGDISGKMVLLSTKETSLRLAELLQSKEKGTLKIMDMMSRSALKEMGNILIGSYLTALSDFSGMSLVESTPVLMNKKAAAIIERAIGTYDELVEYVLVVETKLNIESEKFVEDIILILKPKSFEAIFESISRRAGI